MIIMTINRRKLSQISSSPQQISRWRYQKKMQIPINKIICVLLVVIINLISAELTNAEPCPFHETINITNGEYRPDGSIIFDEVIYPKLEYGTYDYIFTNNSHKIYAEPHIRGCVCSNSKKPCLRLCCNRGYYPAHGQCIQNETFYDIPISIRNAETNELTIVNLFENFRYTTGRPCNELIVYDKSYPDENWELFDNGSVMINGMEKLKSEYCLGSAINANTSETDAIIYACFIGDNQAKFQLFPYGMIASVPFLIITFVVYACLPELRNVHGKSLMCYLLGLAFGYALLAYIQLQGTHSIELVACKAIGYSIYFFFMSAFFWLNVISFDLWWNFRHFAGLIHNARGMKGISKLADNKKFLVYSAYAWLSSLALVLLCYFIDLSSIPLKWKPGFGHGHCFLNSENIITEFLYFYLIIIIIICANSTFFTLTALKIRRVQMEMARITAKEDSRRHQSDLDKEKDKYGLFLRLFIVMGVTWSMEVISWLIDGNSYVFYFSDILNTIQGIIIFILFVLKPKVKQLIIKRMAPVLKTNTESTDLERSNTRNKHNAIRWKIWRGVAPVQRGMSYSGTTKSTLATSNLNHTTTELSLINNVRD